MGVAPVAELILGSVTPSQNVSASSGGTAVYALSLTTQNNTSNSDLSLAVSGVPSGATASFSPSGISGGTGASTLNVVVPAGTVTPGTYNLLITMTGNGAVAQDTVTLTVGP